MRDLCSIVAHIMAIEIFRELNIDQLLIKHSSIMTLNVRYDYLCDCEAEWGLRVPDARQF